MKQSEGRLQDEIRLALNHPEACFFRNNCGAYRLPNGTWVRYGVGSPGGSDLVGIFRGKAVFAEVKTPTGRLSDEQLRFARLVESKGAVFAVLRSTDDAAALLERLGR